MSEQLTLLVESEIRIKNYNELHQDCLDLFKQKVSFGIKTYSVLGNSMMCLMCKTTIWSPLFVRNFYCNICDLFHQPDNTKYRNE